MRRLNHPVYRNRVLQVAADAVLVALAYFLAFQLRFLDEPHGWPHRYEVLFAQSVGFVVVGKLVVFAAFGLYQKWWRYVSGRDFLLIFRAVAVASAILVVVFAVAKPFAHTLPRSVEVIDFMLTLMLIAGARLAVRLIVERPRAAPACPSTRCSSSAPAPAARWSSASCSSTPSSAPPRSASSTTTRASGGCGCWG